MHGLKPLTDSQTTCKIEHSLMQILKYSMAASIAILRIRGEILSPCHFSYYKFPLRYLFSVSQKMLVPAKLFLPRAVGAFS